MSDDVKYSVTVVLPSPEDQKKRRDAYNISVAYFLTKHYAVVILAEEGETLSSVILAISPRFYFMRKAIIRHLEIWIQDPKSIAFRIEHWPEDATPFEFVPLQNVFKVTLRAKTPLSVDKFQNFVEFALGVLLTKDG